jgi:hypothetical protein
MPDHDMQGNLSDLDGYLIPENAVDAAYPAAFDGFLPDAFGRR